MCLRHNLQKLFKSMSKKNLFLIIVLSLSLLIIIYFILTSEVKEIGENDIAVIDNNEKVTRFDSSEYKVKAGRVLGDFLSLEEDNLSLNSVNQLKINLLELRVPAEFKEDHLKTVIILDRIKENFDLETLKIEDELEKIKEIKNHLDNN
jgi:hypothetical protein